MKKEKFITISIPENLGGLFEEVFDRLGINHECIGTGCGSSEYTVATTKKKMKEVLKEVRSSICFDIIPNI